MADELIQTAIVATQVVVTEGKVDESPNVSPEIQAEIDRLGKVKADAEKEAKDAEEKALYWRNEKRRERNEYFRGEGRVEPPAPAIVQPVEAQPPKREDFEDYDKYVEALVEHRTEAKVAKWRKDESEKQGKTEYQQKIDALQEKLSGAYTTYPDFDEVVRDPSVPITMVMRDILTELEHPVEVAYYLGKNRVEAIQIGRMTPFKAHKEMMRIEAEAIKAKPIVKVVSGAPAPIKPVGSGDSLPQKDISKMSQKEYEAYAKEKGMRQF